MVKKFRRVIEGCAELAGVVQKSSETVRPATRVTRPHIAVCVNSAANIGLGASKISNSKHHLKTL